ncbi:MAG: LPS export ABC transporter permease LptF [Nitrospirae bacterium]|nr:LPS export ABC transporter permease LptF [Nitrospirota bacterium]
MIIHRSIFRELFINFLLVISFLSFVLFMEKFVRLTRLIMGKGVEFTDILKVFLFLQPSILLLSVPMAILIAVFLTYGRMNSDNEITAMKSSGMSFWTISKPAVILSVSCFVALLSVSLYISPKSMRAFKHTLYQVIVKKATMAIEEETFSTVFKKTVLFIKNMPSRDRFEGIFVYAEPDSSNKKPVVINARSGEILTYPEEGLIELNMKNGLFHMVTSKGSSEITFMEYTLILTSTIEQQRERKLDEINSVALWKGKGGNARWQAEINKRLAIPFACIIFGILGPALASKTGKTGRVGGFFFSLSVIMVYYFLLIMGEGVAKTGKLPPFLGIWMPNLIFGAVAAISFYMVYTEGGIFTRRSGVKG